MSRRHRRPRPSARLAALLTLPALALAHACTIAPEPAPEPGPVTYYDGEEAAAPDVPMGDPETVERIIELGTTDNRVMDHLAYLCERIGPRLTGSTRAERANEWTRDRFAEWGLTDARLERWGEIAMRFDRAPSYARVLARPTGRRPGPDADAEGFEVFRECEFTWLAWSVGTDGPARGRLVRTPETAAELDERRDDLAGAWVLLDPGYSGRSGIRGIGAAMRQRATQRKQLRTEGVRPEADGDADRILLAVLEAGPAGFVSSTKDERVWTTSANDWRTQTTADLPRDPEIALSEPDFDFLSARLAEGMDLRFEADLACTLTDGPIPVSNTIASIRGTQKPDEYVILSAHLDSWNGPGSTGTVDNGTGAAVTMEAARLLMAAGARPDRTILFILWTGEEQGLLGSEAWVEQNAELLPRISAVFVDDGGTNYEGGLHCIEPMREFLAAATAPINNRFYSETDGAFMNVQIRVNDAMPRGGGSDHAPFNRAGVPGFFWDEVGRANYRHAWHTQNDRLDQAIPEYLHQSATCAAVTAYNLACAPTLLPRQTDGHGATAGAGD